MVKLLIQSKANVNAVDKDGHTALDASANAVKGKQGYRTSKIFVSKINPIHLCMP